ncbi:MAG: hypothetical protein ACI9WU_003840 [Myxococcota bacterium]|jgi:hypothetical protein
MNSAEVTTGTTTTESSFTDLGFLATVMADYYISVGRGMFIKPGIGGGYFRVSGDKDVAGINVAGTNLVEKITRSGGVGRVQLSLVFYTSNQFNLKAGVDVLARFGSKESDQDPSTGSTSILEIDAAWNVGFAYVL